MPTFIVRKCGCEYDAKGNGIFRECPLHAAAEEMRELLNSIADAGEGHHHAWLRDFAPGLIRTLLAKVGG